MEAGKPFTAEDTKLTHAALIPHAATRTFIAYILGRAAEKNVPVAGAPPGLTWRKMKRGTIEFLFPPPPPPLLFHASTTSRQGQSEKSNASTPFGWFGLSNQQEEEEEEKGKK
ncbi:predicted protein [Coccidioides posadasii str. Silveira]|uniref:Predicted protein n=1 Tax=Coccidioides posadasii (strain RMSCC 757 / Silveira) TaxID=443226 RepID=E9D5T1_COCPS|nr:predicted protein [Coccidioides posadasii str. Silveira]